MHCCSGLCKPHCVVSTVPFWQYLHAEMKGNWSNRCNDSCDYDGYGGSWDWDGGQSKLDCDTPCNANLENWQEYSYLKSATQKASNGFLRLIISFHFFCCM